jgi:glucose-1-phosphate cytidylyltransferase
VKAIILAGGLGTRLREETEFRPKPMVEIGGQPILWHIMKIFSHFGVTDFVVCIGYRGDVIKDYFANYETRSNDFTVRLGATKDIVFHDDHRESNWRVTVVDTGQETMTGGRVKRVRPFVAHERCMVTYGDGLADVDIGALLDFHDRHGRLATMTTVRPVTRFGSVDLDDDGTIRQFREKPRGDEYVNGGFFVFEPEVLERYLDEDCVLEQEPLEALARDGQLMGYRHEGYWQPMDTYREFMMLDDLWRSGKAPWKVWNE